jgi:hypothetical protein
MARPAPGSDGDCAHIDWHTVRGQLARGMRLVLITGGYLTRQYLDLLAGSDVQVAAEQISGLVQESLHPATLDDHATWTLSGDDTLTPVT